MESNNKEVYKQNDVTGLPPVALQNSSSLGIAPSDSAAGQLLLVNRKRTKTPRQPIKIEVQTSMIYPNVINKTPVPIKTNSNKNNYVLSE